MLLKIKNYLIKLTFWFLTLILFTNLSQADDSIKNVKEEVEKISADLKILEKAFYKTSELQPAKISPNSINEDILTRHLLKLNEIEEQFQELTNKYEEINFKIDKLSSRITKIQSDNQLRFSDLENLDTLQKPKAKKEKRLPGTDLPQDLGTISKVDLDNKNEVQQTQSVETAGLVVTEKKPMKSQIH